MGWRMILEAEHRLILEVADAADEECEHIRTTDAARTDLASDILEFFRFFGEGLHEPKEDGLLFARCHKRGMTEADEPLQQMIGEHEWCSGRLDRLVAELKALHEGDSRAALAFATDLREYVEVVRCHIEVEESLFFDMARHYLTESDSRQLTKEFESVHDDELEEGVEQHWEALAHRLLAAEGSS